MARHPKTARHGSSGGTGRWIVSGLLGSLALTALLTWRHLQRGPAGLAPQLPPKPVAYEKESDRIVFARYAGSRSCRGCHEQAYKLWEKSHHGLAERAVEPAVDQVAFDPPRVFKHGTQSSEARVRDGRFEVVTQGLDGGRHPYVPERVIGMDPLLQYLIPMSNGFWQSTEIAWDPARKEWFDVYGEEDRRPGEWGHWTGRGMTWNFMCASCHNTRLRRNYDAATDSYATTMVEFGVGCESCHGPMATHVKWQQEHPQRGIKDPTVARFTTNQVIDTCGTCHARRGELTGDFAAGDLFADHYVLTITDETDTYYPDGQVRDEDYEYASFLSSKMRVAGVRCLDCHDPHSGKTKLTGDALCLQCHSAPTPPAPKIDPASHSHHKPGTPGDRCVECHMPITYYMQRHPRHDHGFIIPDPLLTKQFGIPNACSRCHTNQTAEWSLDATAKWYGQRMARPTRTRAQAFGRARNGDAAAVPELVNTVRTDKVPLWRASAAVVLRRWADDNAVTPALIERLGDADPLVRHMAVRALEPLIAARREVHAAIEKRLEDPVRAVRVQAAWTLHAEVDTNSVAGRDLLAFLRTGIDHPAGAMQMGVFLFGRGNPAQALVWFRRAVTWDPNSAPMRDALAVALSQMGHPEEAVKELQAACRLAPKEATFRYRLGLALNEAGQLAEAVKALEEAVRLDASFAQAWYNLGLGYAQQNLLEQSIEALGTAERLNPTSPQIPHARSTVLMRLGRNAEAAEAARRARALQPVGQ